MQRQHSRAPVQGAAAILKGLRLLRLIPELGQGANVKNLQQHMGLPRPTLYRLLNTLEQEGFIERNPLSGAYVLGPQIIRLAQRAVVQSNLQEKARNTLIAIGEATGETVHLAVPYGCHMTYIDKVESPEAVRMASYVGMSVPMHATSVGKAYLAALNERSLEQYLEALSLEAVTSNTCTTLEALREELKRTRAQGYAIDDEENEMGIICFGHVVHGADGAPAGAISVSVPRYRLPEEGCVRIVGAVKRLCRQAGLFDGPER